MDALRRNRDFALLWTTQVVSEVGSEISLVAYPLRGRGSPSAAAVRG